MAEQALRAPAAAARRSQNGARHVQWSLVTSAASPSHSKFQAKRPGPCPPRFCPCCGAGVCGAPPCAGDAAGDERHSVRRSLQVGCSGLGPCTLVPSDRAPHVNGSTCAIGWFRLDWLIKPPCCLWVLSLLCWERGPAPAALLHHAFTHAQAPPSPLAAWKHAGMWCLPRMAAKLRCTCRFRSPRQAGSASAASAAIVRDAGAPPSRQASPACTSLLPCCVRPLHPTPRPTPFPPSPAFAAFACLAQRCPPPQLPLTHTTTPHPRPRPGPRHVVALQKTLWRGFIEKGTFDSSLEAAHQFKEMVRLRGGDACG